MAIALILLAVSIISIFVLFVSKVPVLVDLPQKEGKEKVFFVEKEKVDFWKNRICFCFSLRNLLRRLLLFIFLLSRRVERAAARSLRSLKRRKKES